MDQKLLLKSGKQTILGTENKIAHSLSYFRDTTNNFKIHVVYCTSQHYNSENFTNVDKSFISNTQVKSLNNNLILLLTEPLFSLNVMSHRVLLLSFLSLSPLVLVWGVYWLVDDGEYPGALGEYPALGLREIQNNAERFSSGCYI